jgi:hypothetical protein
MEIKMTKFTTIIAASALSAAALIAGQASADNENSGFADLARQHSTMTDQTMTGHHASYANMGMRSNDMVSVRYINELSKHEGASVLERAEANPAGVVALQAKIRSDRSALHSLEARNVQINNVIDAISAANGDVIYIVR